MQLYTGVRPGSLIILHADVFYSIICVALESFICAAVLILTGRITGLTRPSVCPSCAVRAPNSKQKCIQKHDWCERRSPGGVTGVPVLNSEGQRSRVEVA